QDEHEEPLLGALVACSAGGFAEAELEVLQQLAEPFSVALCNDNRIRELRTLREAAMAENQALLTRLDRQAVSDTVIGATSGLKGVMDRVELVASSDVPVLILGETGTGKEVVARAIHGRSRQSQGPMIRVNCGAIPPELVDSELFGHERGSFTGAVTMRKGWFVLSEPITHDRRVVGLVISGNKKGLDSDICAVEIQFIRAAASYLGILHENLARFAEQHALFAGLVQAMTASIDAKDRYTCGHSERVGLMAAKLAATLGLGKEQIEDFRIAGLLHDVGKIGIPEAVLCKAGRLTDAEYCQIKQHPETGYRILRDVPALTHIIDGVLHHHERWDGRGYPDGLAAEKIPLIARVLALADSFDAMSSTRSYRPAMPRPAVLAEIHRCAGMQFDPSLVPIFTSIDLTEFDQMLERHQKLSACAA
ncbi:MAG TPA: HD domain-containing phosphohydrolase, partial [Tepidisphaeraceae bacterium]|nr:HD domain-containing phosphohydrolase [Tepidisphaeraceae bacterium]